MSELNNRYPVNL